jgi:hypothetical protein
MVENVENKKTLGFAVSGAPIWLCKELSKEAKEYWNNVYWCVIVDWFRKAKAYEDLVKGNEPVEEQPVHEPVEIEEEPRKPTVALFGGEEIEVKKNG